MKEIKAYIRPENVDRVISSIEESGVNRCCRDKDKAAWQLCGLRERRVGYVSIQ